MVAEVVNSTSSNLSYTYDRANRLPRETRSEVTTTYAYDDADNRMTPTVVGATVNYT